MRRIGGFRNYILDKPSLWPHNCGMEAAILQPHFQDPDKAREYLEAKRWPDGQVCPHCGVIGEATKLEPKEGKKTHARKGVWKCNSCREQFSVTVGTIFEDSHIALNKWLYAFHLLCASKKGMWEDT